MTIGSIVVPLLLLARKKQVELPEWISFVCRWPAKCRPQMELDREERTRGFVAARPLVAENHRLVFGTKWSTTKKKEDQLYSSWKVATRPNNIHPPDAFFFCCRCLLLRSAESFRRPANGRFTTGQEMENDVDDNTRPVDKASTYPHHSLGNCQTLEIFTVDWALLKISFLSLMRWGPFYKNHHIDRSSHVKCNVLFTIVSRLIAPISLTTNMLCEKSLEDH